VWVGGGTIFGIFGAKAHADKNSKMAEKQESVESEVPASYTLNRSSK